MPPSTELQDAMQNNITNIGRDTLSVLFNLTGAQDIENEEEADTKFLEEVGKVVISWETIDAKQQRETARILFVKMNPKITDPHENSVIQMESLITRACGTIMRLARNIAVNVKEAGAKLT